MNGKTLNQKIIFGLKVKQLRLAHNFSFAELSASSGLSVSYLNEIEKGKKYPKQDKIKTLARSLSVSFEELTSPELGKGLAPVGDLLHSNFLNEIPFDLFGIKLPQVIEIIANAPDRVGAFISTLIELSRKYAVQEENFYFAAMRAYQEMHNNYFEDIEKAAADFVTKYKLPMTKAVPPKELAEILIKEFKYTIVEDGLAKYPELRHLRSVFVPKSKKLLLNDKLNDFQLSFQLGKEIGFNFLGLEAHGEASTLQTATNFEQVLDNFKAAYFSVAILINRNEMVTALTGFFQQEKWNGQFFLDLMNRFKVSPEILLQRFNVLPEYFGINKLFFQRFIHNPERGNFVIDKELHLHRFHRPHANGLSEHYCRRWSALSILSDVQEIQDTGKYLGPVVTAQLERYMGTEDEYICFTIARPAYPTPNRNVSVTIGLLVDDHLRSHIKFLDDPALVRRDVNITCERCPAVDCKERVKPPIEIERKQERSTLRNRIKQVIEEN